MYQFEEFEKSSLNHLNESAELSLSLEDRISQYLLDHRTTCDY